MLTARPVWWSYWAVFVFGPLARSKGVYLTCVCVWWSVCVSILASLYAAPAVGSAVWFLAQGSQLLTAQLKRWMESKERERGGKKGKGVCVIKQNGGGGRKEERWCKHSRGRKHKWEVKWTQKRTEKMYMFWKFYFKAFCRRRKNWSGDSHCSHPPCPPRRLLSECKPHSLELKIDKTACLPVTKQPSQ